MRRNSVFCLLDQAVAVGDYIAVLSTDGYASGNSYETIVGCPSTGGR